MTLVNTLQTMCSSDRQKSKSIIMLLQRWQKLSAICECSKTGTSGMEVDKDVTDKSVVSKILGCSLVRGFFFITMSSCYLLFLFLPFPFSSYLSLEAKIRAVLTDTSHSHLLWAFQQV